MELSWYQELWRGVKDVAVGLVYLAGIVAFIYVLATILKATQ